MRAVIKINVKIGKHELAKVLHYYGFDENDIKITCPFHADINPSMSIKMDTGTFYCHACEVSGNALDFVKRAEGINDDLEACKTYIKVLKSKKVNKIKAPSVEKRYIDNKQALIEAKDYYFGLKTIDWNDTSDEEICEVFNYMKKRGFTAKTLNQCKAKLTYNKSYPIIFPMFDNETFKGWVCRTTNKRIEKKRKYLYNEGFSRATTLCGTHKSKTIVVVEGYMDKLKFNQFGLTNVVALLGWKMSAQQLESLKKDGVETVISALDTDKCGIKGTAYLSNFFKVIKFQYPEGIKDAGEMNKKQFVPAYKNTKKLLLEEKRNGIDRRHQKRRKKVRNKQR